MCVFVLYSLNMALLLKGEWNSGILKGASTALRLHHRSFPPSPTRACRQIFGILGPGWVDGSFILELSLCFHSYNLYLLPVPYLMACIASDTHANRFHWLGSPGSWAWLSLGNCLLVPVHIWHACGSYQISRHLGPQIRTQTNVRRLEPAMFRCDQRALCYSVTHNNGKECKAERHE